eukprot:TRINITY_DN8023_c0_g1_i2.p1 TRINITY_DN8023_c0_g1~~TRINITY_DN8023_c0_g1_i2.p1  ORF type:complete len:439 (-),score=31.69 TRINITY_DN8023_c0_g1_i2:451-1767(-)
MNSCWVVVLGDYGRSPRMQYHTLSLLENGYDVNVVAYHDSPPIQELQQYSASQLRLINIPTVNAGVLATLPTIISLICKTLFQTVVLAWILLLSRQLNDPQFVIIQNPPSVPILGITLIAAKIRKAQLIVDWHNFGYTILQLKFQQDNVLVVLYKWFEFFWGKKADQHICVSKAMAQKLAQDIGIKAVVFYDKPQSRFHPISIKQTHYLFSKLRNQIKQPLHPDDCITRIINEEEGDSLITIRTNDDEYLFKQNRVRIVISSTSWTQDENFDILLQAAKIYDACDDDSLPSVLFFITGKGPLKQFYYEKLCRLRFRRVAFRLVWLEIEDYPKILASADLGISLHASSSGYDLPMKIVDMFGAGIPVATLEYNCIEELVQNNETGLLFITDEQLGRILIQNLSNTSLLERLKAAVLQWQQENRWSETWNQSVLPILQSF